MTDQQTIQLFVNTRDSLRPASIAALIDIADGQGLPIYHEWLLNALVERGLIYELILNREVYERQMAERGYPYLEVTDYGRAFVNWYRQPRDLPLQMSLFDEGEG
jgi:hypothetical protein